MPGARPRQRVRELRLAPKKVGHSRLPNGEGYRSGARVSGRERLGLPIRYRVAIQPGKSGLVEEARAELRRVIHLGCPRPPRVEARHAWSARAPYSILRAVVVKPIDVHAV